MTQTPFLMSERIEPGISRNNITDHGFVGKSAVRRIILVRKKKPVEDEVLLGGDRSNAINIFDEYIRKAGLEPKTYQREGVEFCLRREDGQCSGGAPAPPTPAAAIRGGIIADEMGLGKTIVMMGLILANLSMYRRTLIVVPVALIAQWIDQIKKTIIDTGVKSDLVVVVFHGSAGKRSVVLSNDDEGSVWCHRPPQRGRKNGATETETETEHRRRRRSIDIIITTYGCVAMEEPETKKKGAGAAAAGTGTAGAGTVETTGTGAARKSLLTFRADRIIFDEAHHLRNKNSRIFKGAMRLVVNRPPGHMYCRPSVWIVTGTPIQNKISDLKSLCYILGFQMCDVISEEKRRAIRDEYVLRRTKVSVGMVVDDPAEAKEEDDVSLCAPRLQSLKHYNSQVPWSSENELDLSREIHRSAKNTRDRAERLKLYTQMRQMCVCPALLRLPSGDDGDRHGLSRDDYQIAVSKQSKLDRVIATMIAEATAVADAADAADAENIRQPRRKSIIFCHYRREMTQLRDMLLRSRVVVAGEDDIAMIDGTVKSKERVRIFATAPSVLILQIRTCSEGLNLQAYSDVYFVSPHWNPCVEDQAIARCYRMGQTNVVRVFRFYMTDFVVAEGGEEEGATGAGAAGAAVAEGSISTLDHKCEEIQERKRILCNEFLCG